MKQQNHYIRNALAPALLIFTASAVIMYLRLRNMVIADAIAYLSVTERIMDGDITGSVNGYWSPLVSWLLLPFCATGLNGIAAFQLLNLVLAAGCLWLLYRLLLQLHMSNLLQTAVLCGAATLLPFWAFNYLTADMLFLLLLLWYILLQLNGRFYERPWQLACCGLLLYLAKAYGLFFFMGHSLLMLAYRHYVQKKKVAWRRVLAGYALMIAVCGLWVTAISSRYGHFTVSEAGAYNRSIAQSGKIIHPCDTLGMLPLLPGERYFAWEEMTRHVAYPAPAAGLLKAVPENAAVTVRLLMKTPRYGLAFFVFTFLFLLFAKKRLKHEQVILISAWLLFTGGYCLLFVEERYLLFPVLLLVLLIAAAVQEWWPQARVKWMWLPALLFAYTLMRPAVDGYRHTNTADEDMTAGRSLALDRQGQNRRYAAIQPYRFATLAYYYNWQDLGGLAGYGKDSVRMLNDLRKYNVDFIITGETERLPGNVAAEYSTMVHTYIHSMTVVWGKK